MIKIENTINNAVIYADSIDPGAEGLIRALCGSPISRDSQIRVMPDVHPGKGCAVGMTMTLTDTVAPGLVGSDIGCGMTVWKISGRRVELQKLEIVGYENPCHAIVEALAKKLEELLAGRRIFRPANAGQLGC